MAKGPEGFADAGGSLSLLQRGIGSSWVDLPPPISIPRCTVRKTVDRTKPLAFIRCNFVCDGHQVVSTFPVRCHDGGGFPSDQRSRQVRKLVPREGFAETHSSGAAQHGFPSQFTCLARSDAVERR